MIIQTRYGTISLVRDYCWSHVVPKRRMDWRSRPPLRWAGWIWDVVYGPLH